MTVGLCGWLACLPVYPDAEISLDYSLEWEMATNTCKVKRGHKVNMEKISVSSNADVGEKTDI